MKKICSALVFGMVLSGNITYATTIDFEKYPSLNPNQGDYYSTLTEDGFVLTKGNGWSLELIMQPYLILELYHCWLKVVTMLVSHLDQILVRYLTYLVS